MSINFCTIASSPVDGFCGTQRAKVLARLIPILHPAVPPVVTTGTNPRVLRDTFKFNRPFEIEDQPTLTFEQPTVTVSAEIFGYYGTDTQDVSAAQVDFVSISDFEFGSSVHEPDHDAGVIAVNITELTFE
jgi:hypothetical protein